MFSDPGEKKQQKNNPCIPPETPTLKQKQTLNFEENPCARKTKKNGI